MNALCMNVGNTAVTEYSTPFTGLAGDYEITDAGVYQVGGETDSGQAIATQTDFGLTLTDGEKQRRALYLYLNGTDLDALTCAVTTGAGQTFTYDNRQIHDRATRFILGRGIRDEYLKFSIRSTGGANFTIDNAQFEFAPSKNRRM